MADERLHELKRKRAVLIAERREKVAEYRALAERQADLPDGEELPDDERTKLDQILEAIQALDSKVQDHDSRIDSLEKAIKLESENASEAGDDGDRGIQPGIQRGLPAQAKKRDHETDKSLVLAGCAKMLGAGGGNIYAARQASLEIYGENHPVTRALNVSTAPAGGFMVPPDYVAELIELLRAQTVVRASGPRVLPMPRGTMTLPRQSQAATAVYGAELAAIPVSQQAVDQIVATYHKLTAMVPISNDLMRYSDPAVDAMVRDDLAQVIARREDLAFIRGDGTQDSPKGFLSFLLPANTIASNASYTLSTAASELGGLLNKIETSNVPIVRPVWLMHPRTKNYLLNVQNANGFYVYREEMTDKQTLLGVPWKTTTQIPINLTVSSNSDCSELYLVEMTQAMILDSMSLELAVSREGTYVDAGGNTVSVFQSDQTLIRAIAEHDFQMRHNEAIAVLTGVRWAPAIS
jgi:HK97 family phage major capsid protein